jgi:enoyl-CoA hydratase/carnithine racemase
MLQIHDDDGRGVRVLTFDRPQKLNAMNTAMYRACAAALTDAAADDGVGAVVLTGNGRAFSAGADLAELAEAASGAPGADQGEAFSAFLDALLDCPKAVLAAVNGVGVGIGMTLLPYCDVVLIAESARLRAPFVPLGVTTEASSSVTLASIMGWQRAARILLTGAWVGAAEAVELGLAAEVVPDGEVLPRTLALAREIVAAGPLASIVATKRLLVAGRRDMILAARQREEQAFASLFAAAGSPPPPAGH